MSSILVQDVHYAVNSAHILRGVALEIQAGEIFGILGMSGSGKTTLLRSMIGLIRPTSGSIMMLGQDVARLTERELLALRKQVGMVFQGSALFDSLSVAANVAFALREHTQMNGQEIAKKVSEKLALVGLSGHEKYMPGELSGGMRKRVGIARALALDPEVMLYDEPTSGLDPIIGARIDRLIADLSRRLGVTSVVVSHSVRNMLNLCDRLAMLEKGCVTFTGTVAELQASQDPLIQKFIADDPEHPVEE